eukprot:scaffold14566_cov139-Skeletonema_marinoi.AAC.6
MIIEGVISSFVSLSTWLMEHSGIVFQSASTSGAMIRGGAQLEAICCLLKYYEIINRSSVANNEFLSPPPNAVQLPQSVKECPTIHEVVRRSSSFIISCCSTQYRSEFE